MPAECEGPYLSERCSFAGQRVPPAHVTLLSILTCACGDVTLIRLYAALRGARFRSLAAG